MEEVFKKLFWNLHVVVAVVVVVVQVYKVFLCPCTHPTPTTYTESTDARTDPFFKFVPMRRNQTQDLVPCLLPWFACVPYCFQSNCIIPTTLLDMILY